jgi:hypothetical protein
MSSSSARRLGDERHREGTESADKVARSAPIRWAEVALLGRRQAGGSDGTGRGEEPSTGGNGLHLQSLALSSAHESEGDGDTIRT